MRYRPCLTDFAIVARCRWTRVVTCACVGPSACHVAGVCCIAVGCVSCVIGDMLVGKALQLGRHSQGWMQPPPVLLLVYLHCVSCCLALQRLCMSIAAAVYV